MTINLKTGQEYDPRPEDYCTKVTGCVAADIPTPLWLAFLERITDGDKDLQDYLQRVAGYCLTGSIQEHALFFLYGTGANGKSVFTGILASIWGDYAVTAPIDLFMQSTHEPHPTGLAHLHGARLVIASETDGGARWCEAKIKRLTGGELISARFMRCDFFDFMPTFKLMLAGNHIPTLRHVDEAIRRRLQLVPFTVTIPEAERDERLPDKLKAEWPGILHWAVKGCLAWQEIGLRPPAAVTRATGAYLEAEDSLGQWLEECCDRTAEWQFERTVDLYASYKRWLEKAGEHPPSMKRFSMTLRERALVPKKNAANQAGFFHVRLTAGAVD